MRKILIFSGTTEGKALAIKLSGEGIACTVCVATEYGELVMPKLSGVEIHTGRMTKNEMETWMREGGYAAVVDATHPFAVEVSSNIREAAKDATLLYLRLKRDTEDAGRQMTFERNEGAQMWSEGSAGVQTRSEGSAGGRAFSGRAVWDGSGVQKYFFPNTAECAKALASVSGNILLTTGSKELAVFAENPTVRERLYVRVLPGSESIRLCEESQIAGKHIIAMQGPFSEELNAALIRQFSIRCLVTKESGKAGGYEQKLSAAEACGIPVYIIQNPEKNAAGMSFSQVYDKIRELVSGEISQAEASETKPEVHRKEAKEIKLKMHRKEAKETKSEICMERVREAECEVDEEEEKNPGKLLPIALVGIGMGNPDTLTIAAKDAIAHADVVFGAKRLLALVDTKEQTYPYYLAGDILPHLKTLAPGSRVAVLFSGDTGFYSGCSKMREKLIEAGYENISVYPGISSVAYLAAKTGISWQDAKIISIHGRGEEYAWKASVVEAVRYHARTFVLMSGADQVRRMGDILIESGLDACQVWTGFQLSYPEETVSCLTAKQCSLVEQEGLYVCLICNPEVSAKPVTHGWADEVFLRERVPMTKEEVREVSISKLKLYEGAVVYDIGSGTGSIAMETADRSSTIQVYAIEKKHEAVQLIRANQKKFALSNIEVVEASAPEGLMVLPTPTHAFIGGSSGNLKEILEVLFQKNPSVRVVMNAVSLETISEITQLIREGIIRNPDIVWVQASRAKELGAYHLMQAENPIMIVTISGSAHVE